MKYDKSYIIQIGKDYVSMIDEDTGEYVLTEKLSEAARYTAGGAIIASDRINNPNAQMLQLLNERL